MSDRPCGDPEVHGPHSPNGMTPASGLEWCPGISEFDVRASDLLVDLAEAAAANNQKRSARSLGGCAVCLALQKMDIQAKSAVEAAIAGTIGRDRLVSILQSHGYDVGRRSLERHRQEGHTP